MSDIGPSGANQSGDWAFISRHLHPKSRAKEPKAESSNGSPSKGQQTWFIPSVKVVSAPVTGTEDQVLFSNDGDVNDCPVSNDAQECLECIVIIFGGEAADD